MQPMGSGMFAWPKKSAHRNYYEGSAVVKIGDGNFCS